MKINNYFKKISSENYIQEWFVGEPLTLENAVECIIETYPLPVGLAVDDVRKWVKDEVADFNSVVDTENHLPIK